MLETAMTVLSATAIRAAGGASRSIFDAADGARRVAAFGDSRGAEAALLDPAARGRRAAGSAGMRPPRRVPPVGARAGQEARRRFLVRPPDGGGLAARAGPGGTRGAAAAPRRLSRWPGRAVICPCEPVSRAEWPESRAAAPPHPSRRAAGLETPGRRCRICARRAISRRPRPGQGRRNWSRRPRRAGLGVTVGMARGKRRRRSALSDDQIAGADLLRRRWKTQVGGRSSRCQAGPHADGRPASRGGAELSGLAMTTLASSRHFDGRARASTGREPGADVGYIQVIRTRQMPAGQCWIGRWCCRINRRYLPAPVQRRSLVRHTERARSRLARAGSAIAAFGHLCSEPHLAQHEVELPGQGGRLKRSQRRAPPVLRRAV